MTHVEVAATIAPKNTLEQTLLDQLEQTKSVVDVIELRIDQWHKFEIEIIENMVALLHQVNPTAKVLITYRTAHQGGKGDKAQAAYYDLLETLLKVTGMDMIDIEWEEAHKTEIQTLVNAAQAKGVAVVLSQHDFDKTPPLEELKFTYFKMSKTGAQYLKLAVMPQNPEDVTNLLDALYLSSESLEASVIGISMSQLGLVSRTAQGAFGGSVSYGCLGEPQAPGQIHVSKLKELLTLYELNK